MIRSTLAALVLAWAALGCKSAPPKLPPPAQPAPSTSAAETSPLIVEKETAAAILYVDGRDPSVRRRWFFHYKGFDQPGQPPRSPAQVFEDPGTKAYPKPLSEVRVMDKPLGRPGHLEFRRFAQGPTSVSGFYAFVEQGSGWKAALGPEFCQPALWWGMSESEARAACLGAR